MGRELNVCRFSRRYIDDDGNVIRVPGQTYLENGVKVQY